MELEYWEFEFSGKNSSDVQGIGLREEIREIAVKIGINGVAKNEKKNGKVKVVCLVQNDEKAAEFFSKILASQNPLIRGKIDEQKSKKTKITFDPPQTNHQFDGFHIEKEDELTEMVWALQGAGKVFALQETNRITSLNRALNYALTAISDCAGDLQTNPQSKRGFVEIALHNYIKECPTEDQELINNLYDLTHFCGKANMLLDYRKPEQEVELSDLLGKILILSSKIQDKLLKSAKE